MFQKINMHIDKEEYNETKRWFYIPEKYIIFCDHHNTYLKFSYDIFIQIFVIS